MNNLSEKVSDLNQLITAGRYMDAFEKYYHEEVKMQENENPPTVGKSANRNRELDFLSKTVVKEARPLKVTVGENFSMVEWHFNYTHEEWGEKNYRQVSVQEWKDGRIFHEKYYYPN